MKTCAIGLMTKNRFDLTKQTLDSLFYTDQDKSSYDIFIIDNGSDTANLRNVKDYIKASALPVKNFISIPDTRLSVAWNLFFALARNYEYRIKLDNDIVFKGSLVVMSNTKMSPAMPTPFTAGGTNPGAIPTGPPILGAGMSYASINRRKERNQMQAHSRFLDHMKSFAKENQVDLVSLLPVPGGQTFVNMFNAAITKKWNGFSFLLGGCVFITRKCFEKIGYFHEELPCRLDIEYSQRAIRNGFNIGYHPYYHVTHIGHGNNTESDTQRKFKNQEAISIEQSHTIETFSESKWQSAIYDIEDACRKNTILHLL